MTTTLSQRLVALGICFLSWSCAEVSEPKVFERVRICGEEFPTNTTEIVFDYVPDASVCSLPSEIGKLSVLQILDLGQRRDSMTGTIPTQIGQLRELQNFVASGCSFRGTIPTQIGHLSALQTMDLSANRLRGPIPTQLTNLNLTKLQLQGNPFNATIPAFTKMTTLVVLDLSSAGLVGSIPTQLGNLVLLSGILLYHNSLNGTIPSQIGKLPALDILNLENNQFTGTIPIELSNCTNLGRLILAGNSFKGAIPNEFNALPLVDLSVQNNPFLCGDLSWCAISPFYGSPMLAVSNTLVSKISSQSCFAPPWSFPDYCDDCLVSASQCPYCSQKSAEFFSVVVSGGSQVLTGINDTVEIQITADEMVMITQVFIGEGDATLVQSGFTANFAVRWNATYTVAQGDKSGRQNIRTEFLVFGAEDSAPCPFEDTTDGSTVDFVIPSPVTSPTPSTSPLPHNDRKQLPHITYWVMNGFAGVLVTAVVVTGIVIHKSKTKRFPWTTFVTLLSVLLILAAIPVSGLQKLDLASQKTQSIGHDMLPHLLTTPSLTIMLSLFIEIRVIHQTVTDEGYVQWDVPNRSCLHLLCLVVAPVALNTLLIALILQFDTELLFLWVESSLFVCLAVVAAAFLLCWAKSPKPGNATFQSQTLCFVAFVTVVAIVAEHLVDSETWFLVVCAHSFLVALPPTLLIISDQFKSKIARYLKKGKKKEKLNHENSGSL